MAKGGKWGQGVNRETPQRETGDEIATVAI